MSAAAAVEWVSAFGSFPSLSWGERLSKTRQNVPLPSLSFFLSLSEESGVQHIVCDSRSFVACRTLQLSLRGSKGTKNYHISIKSNKKWQAIKWNRRRTVIFWRNVGLMSFFLCPRLTDRPGESEAITENFWVRPVHFKRTNACLPSSRGKSQRPLEVRRWQQEVEEWVSVTTGHSRFEIYLRDTSRKWIVG